MLKKLVPYTLICLFTFSYTANGQGDLVVPQNLNEFVKSPGYSFEEGIKYNDKEFLSHPDFGKLTFKAPYGKNVVEDISKRTEFSRYYIDINHPAYFYIEQSSKPINIQKDGFFRAIDPSLHKVSQGIYQSGFQHYQTTLNQTVQKTKMSFGGEFIEFNDYLLKVVHTDNSIEIIEPDWSNIHMTNFSGYITDVFPGIDMKIEFYKGRVKSNFIVKQNLNVKELIFIDQLNLSTELGVILSDQNPFNQVFLEIYNVETSETEIVVQPALTYENSGNKDAWISKFELNGTDLYTILDSAHLNNIGLTYPITIDPTFIAVGPVTNGGGVHGSVQVPGTCTDNIVVAFPGGAEPWDTQFSWTIYTQQCAGSFFLFGLNDACFLSDARIWISGCAATSPAAAPVTIWACVGAGCNVPGFWTPTLPFGSDGTADLVACYPTQCAAQNMTFTINTARGYCPAYTVYDNCNWANSFCVSLDDWSATVQGRSVETLGNTATGNGTQNIYDADCIGTQTLDPTPLYGVPGYTYLWNTGATSSTLTVPGTVSTYTADVTDACGTTVTATFDIGCPLSTELSDFSLTKKDRSALLLWTTMNEVDNDQFILEKSVDGLNWRSFREVQGAGNSEQEISYEFRDDVTQSGINYYRIKYATTENEFKYSEVKSVEFDYLYSVFPNPAKDQLTIVNMLDESTSANYQVLDALGNVIVNGNFSTKTHEIDVSQLRTGVYLVKISQDDNVLETIRFVKD